MGRSYLYKLSVSNSAISHLPLPHSLQPLNSPPETTSASTEAGLPPLFRPLLYPNLTGGMRPSRLSFSGSYNARIQAAQWRPHCYV